MKGDGLMKKIINDPFNFVDESMEGILAAHSNLLKAAEGNVRAIVRADAPAAHKVAVATGGGSGHLPVFLGYVGRGMADGCAVGNVFSSPTSSQMKQVTKAVDSGRGVLYIYGRYQGDMMNFDMAAEDCAEDGIEVQTVLVTDDVASAPPGRMAKEARRGRFVFCLQNSRCESGNRIRSVICQDCCGKSRLQYEKYGSCTWFLYTSHSRQTYLFRLR